jgi:hypothetical protein
LFAAELSFFAAIVGAYVVLAFSSPSAAPFFFRAETRAVYLAVACLAVHVSTGAVVQRRSRDNGAAKLFWKLTFLLCAAVLVPMVLVTVLKR